MNCTETRRDIAAYLYGELSPEHRHDLEQHLLACVSCRKQADDDRASMRLLDAWPSLQLADDEQLIAKLDRATDRRAVRNRPRVGWRAPLLGAAAALLVFALLTWIGTDASLENGRLSIGFGRPAASPVIPSHAMRTTPLIDERSGGQITTVGQINQRFETFADALDRVLDDLDQRQQERLLTLARALEERRAQGESRFERRLTDVGRELYRQTQENRSALIRMVSFEEGSGAVDTPRRLRGSRPDEIDRHR